MQPNPGSYRHALRLIVPMILGRAAFTVMQFTDRLLLARHSSEAIQAALPSGMLSFTLLGFFTAIAGYAGTFVSQYHGAKEERGCIRACAVGLWLSLLFLPLFLALVPVCNALMHLAGHPPALEALERTYAFWMLIGAFPVSLHWVLDGYLVGRGRVFQSTCATILSCLLNIGLDILLIFGYWGLPAMGLRGAAIATVLSECAATLFLALAIALEPGARIRPWIEALRRPDFPLLRRVVRFGAPAGFDILSNCGSFSFYLLMTGRLDALSLATSNIAFSINNLAFSPLMGFGSAAAILVGQFQGAGDGDNASRAGWRCLHLGWCYMALVGAAFLFLPETLLSLFRSADAPYTVEQMIHLGKKLLLLIAIWGVFDTANIVFSGALKGAGDTTFVMATFTFINWLFWIPSEWYVLQVRNMGLLPSWYLQVAFVALTSLFFVVRWCGGRWKSIDLLNTKSHARKYSA